MQEPSDIKVFVDVNVAFRSYGVTLPKEIIWEDGTRYENDRVKQIDQAAARRAGGQGDRYMIVVNGQETVLFFERSTNLTGNIIRRRFCERRTA